jgi:hypothetical protein
MHFHTALLLVQDDTQVALDFATPCEGDYQTLPGHKRRNG